MPTPSAIVLMGVTGSGKTTVGRKLAGVLGWAFHDADDLHPEANIDKMSRGTPLTDADRGPWLSAIRALIIEAVSSQQPVVVACSALKETYRRTLLEDVGSATLVHLRGSPELIEQRLKERTSHFMPAGLIQSQFHDLEEPEGAFVVDASLGVDEIVAEVLEYIDLAASTPLVDLASLGLEPVINANTTLTRLGGSLMPPPVLDAMRSAATEFVDIHELSVAAGQRLAELTQNEAAYVSSGAAAGLALAALATMTGPDSDAIDRIAEGHIGDLSRTEIIVQRPQRTPYDRAFHLTGARIVRVGSETRATRLELEAAINHRTAAIFHFAGAHLASGVVGLGEVIEIGRAAKVPVIVDAAAQLPPAENLWAYTQAGADLAIFSGGKGLRGPSPSGLLVGRKELVETCALHGYPNQRSGRPMKVGKEEIMGLVAAVEWFLAQDHAAEADRIERATRLWVDALGVLPGVQAHRDYPGEAGRPVPRALVAWTAGSTAAQIRTSLLAGKPRIDVAEAGPRSLYLNAELLTDDQVDIVELRVHQVLSELGKIKRKVDAEATRLV